jgi:mRNA interferase HicA
MKQNALIKILKKNGWELLRHGANHDIYTNGTYNIAVPRHKEIKERTAHIILQEAGIE